MAIKGFDSDYYVNSLFAYLQEEFSEWADKTVDDAKELIQNEQPADDFDTSAEMYYMANLDNGLAPNEFFNAKEYRLAWAKVQVQENMATSEAAALLAYDAAIGDTNDHYAHYQAYGAAMGVNPSNLFDESDYLQNIITTLAWDGVTVDALRDFAVENGWTPLDLYITYPESHATLPAFEVQGDERVDVAPVVDSFTLTENTDVASANVFTAGLVYTPGGDDRINALQDEDKLTGTGDNPTLNAELGNSLDNGGVIVTPELNNIETLNVAFTGSGTAGINSGGPVVSLDVQDATGLKEVNITRVTQASNAAFVDNIKQVLETMSVSNTNANNAGTVEFSFGTTTLAGDNTATLNLSDVQITNLNIGGNIAAGGPGAPGVAGTSYENLTVNSVGAANSIAVFGLPMDTGTAGTVTITGDQDLTIAQTTTITNGVLPESRNYAGGIAQANGRLAAIDASAFTGNLTLDIAAGNLTTGKAGTSGAAQNVSITGGTGNDTFYLGDAVQAGDSLTGGDGDDTMIIYNGGSVSSASSVVSSIEALRVEMSAAVATVDFDKLPDVASVTVRNVSNNGAVSVAGNDVFTLNNLTAAQAAAIGIEHSNTGSNGITQNVVNANLKVATGTSDTVAFTITDNANTDARFNARLNAASVENITINDSDSESNTFALGNAANHTGTITLAGGAAGTFISLDTTTNPANVPSTGMYQYDNTTGLTDANSSNAGATVGRIADMSGVATQVRLGAATIDASAEASNVIVRVGTNAASAVGAQKITMGTGDDTVIFDNLTDTRAGLSISDTVAGGTGNDTIALDGNVAVTLAASEWTNVSGFENIRLVGNGATYALTLTDNILATNSDATTGYLNVINDNDLFNDTARTFDVANGITTPLTVTNSNGTSVAVLNDAGLVASNLTLDVSSLSAGSKWSYNGNEGPGRSTDTFIMSDANIDGNAVIDGGAINNITNDMGIASLDGTTIVGNGAALNKGNADTIQILNAAVVATGDLANIKNIGTLSFTNDKAATQTSTLQLNDSIVDSMVDSYQASVSLAAAATQTTGGANVEVLQVNAVDNINSATGLLTAATALNIQANGLTDKSALDITLGRGVNTVATGAGQDRVVLLGNYVAGTYAVTENGVNLNAQSDGVAVARVVTDNINLGTGIDTLVTYGALNLGGATLAGIENLVINSDVTINESQLDDFASITFAGAGPHTLTIIDDVAGVATVNGALIHNTGTGVLTLNATSDSIYNVSQIEGTVVTPNINTAPVATNDAFTISAARTFTFAELTGNDTDVDGDALTITGVSNAAHGTVLLDNVAGTVTFTPTAGYTGTDATFTYTVADVHNATDTGNVAITVEAPVVPAGTLAYSATTFVEAAANDGSISTTSTLTLTGDTFAGAVGTDLSSSVTNVPAGLTASLVVASSTTATLSFTGNATAHENANDISNLTVTLPATAFTAGVAATGATNSTLVVDFANAGAATYTNYSIDGLGTDAAPATHDASTGTGTFNYTDDVAARGNISISNFGADDMITITGATSAVYDSSISTNGTDVTISYNNGGQLNIITLVGVNTGGAFVNSVAAFNALAVGDLAFA